MDRLLSIGFEVAGHWSLADNATRIQIEFVRHARQENILYAFVCDGTVRYVGKTTGSLARRMNGYRNAAPGQVTNFRNKAHLVEALRDGKAVDVLALPDSGLMHYGIFHLNLAAALEDDIIRRLSPAWNGGRSDAQVAEEVVDAEEELQSTVKDFHVVIGATYWRQGFFNVPAASQASIGADGEKIEVYLSDALLPVLGTINRRCTGNGTPRIMGGVPLRDWFQANLRESGSASVEVLSPTSIRIKVTIA